MNIRELPELSNYEKGLLTIWWTEIHDLTDDYFNSTPDWYFQLLWEEMEYGSQQETLETFDVETAEEYLSCQLYHLEHNVNGVPFHKTQLTFEP